MEELKIASYISMIQKIKDLSFLDPVEEDPLLRGNLAFFVDQYFGDGRWESILRKFDLYVRNNDVNELCMMIAEYIFKKALPLQPKVEHGDAILKLCYELCQQHYENSELNSFVLVNEMFFPNWIYLAEFILGYNE